MATAAAGTRKTSGRSRILSPPSLFDKKEVAVRPLLLHSTRRPGHITAGKHMEMQMEHALPRLFSDIGNHAKTIHLHIRRNFSDYLKTMCHNGAVGRIYCSHRLDMLLGNDQKMCGRLWINVIKSIAQFVFITFFEGISPATILQNRQSSIQTAPFCVFIIADLEQCFNNIVDRFQCFLQFFRLLAAGSCTIRTATAAAANHLSHFLDNFSGMGALLNGLRTTNTQ